MINPSARMSTLNLQSVSLIHPQCHSYCSTGAKSKGLTPKTSFLPFGHSSAFIYAHSFNGNKCRQGVKCRAWGAKKQPDENPVRSAEKAKEAEKKVNDKEEEEYVEEEVELTWIQEKAEDLVEFTGTVTQAIPGPRVGQTSLPWVVAVPLAYIGLSFVIAVVKTIRKLNSPMAKKRRLVNKNATLCKTLDELLQSKRDELNYAALVRLTRKITPRLHIGGIIAKTSRLITNRNQAENFNMRAGSTLPFTGFGMEEILRKYIRYALNEKPFDPDLVANLIHLRKSSTLEDGKVAEVLNEVSRRIVKEKGPVVMDTEGFTEKGIQRKVAVQALFSKLLYLAELDEFCSTTRGSLSIKEIFGVTDEDADALRIETLSEESDVDSLENMVKSASDSDSEEADTENR